MTALTPDQIRSSYRWRCLAADFKQASREHVNDDGSTGAHCWRCKQPIDYDARPNTPSAFEADHRHPLITHPHLAFIWSNLRPCHCSCNRSRGAQVVIDEGEWIQADWD